MCPVKLNRIRKRCNLCRLQRFSFALFWHIEHCIVVTSEEKTFVASIGKEYPFPYFRPLSLRCVG